MRGENWKDLWHQACRVKDLQMASRKWLRSWRLHPKRLQKRFMNASWNLMNPLGNERNLLRLKILKTTWQAKGLLRCHITMWFASLFRCLKRWKFRRRKQQWTRNGKSSKRFQPGNSGSTKRQKESPLCNIDGHMLPQECGVGTKITEVQRQSRAPWWHCKRRLWSLCSFYCSGLVCAPDEWQVPNWECMFVHRKQGIFLSVFVDDIKMAGRSRIWLPCGRNWWKNVDVEEPASLLDHENLGCTRT